jgi:rubrerythrin
MSEQNQEVADILRMAIKGEEDGFFFYDLLSKKATNNDAKRKLENLRDDESRHKETLVGIFHKYVGDEIGELPPKGINALAEVFRRGHLEERKTEMEFLNLAIEAEIAATKYYQEQRELIKDATFQEIFDKLADEENGHYQLLMAEKEALAGNYYWFEYDESSPMEH